ncbi:hypothetical protein HF325_006785 [Metschnikowia pulcherrima]|uniref:Uncharacterized protein n=1 Tax=Metschnikowia pulcherrima TaxID=27326 RepID=A0A8H7GKJ7_9ASCO|nr:hypothetical protein HF325_006785 [Metschnikowia pulcherrima]
MKIAIFLLPNLFLSLAAENLLVNNLGPNSTITKLNRVDLLEGFHHGPDKINQSSEKLENSDAMEAQKAKMLLEWFLRDLKLYVTETDFDHRAFEKNIAKLRHRLADTEFQVVSKLNHDDGMEKLTANVRKVFQIFVDSADRLNRYLASDLPGHDEIYRIIQLYVRTIAMKNPQEMLDRQIVGVKRKLKHLICSYMDVEADIKQQARVPPGMQALFELYAKEARIMLSAFKSQAGIQKKDDQICFEIDGVHKGHTKGV